MVVMSDEMWSVIMDNLTFDEKDVLMARVDTEVYDIKDDDTRYVMELLINQKDELEARIASIEKQRVQDRHMVGILKNCIKTISEVWLTLNNCEKED